MSSTTPILSRPQCVKIQMEKKCLIFGGMIYTRSLIQVSVVFNPIVGYLIWAPKIFTKQFIILSAKPTD